MYLTVLHDEDDVAERRHVRARVSANGDHVGGEPWLERAGDTLDAQQRGGAGGRGAECVERLHALAHHHLELARVGSGQLEGVASKRDLHAARERAVEALRMLLAGLGELRLLLRGHATEE